MEYVLQTDGLTKRYGRFAALDGLTMSVPRGSIYGFVGKNGAGKTTLFRLLCGLQAPTSGHFRLWGIPHDDRGIHRARQRMRAIIEAPAVYADLSAEDNLRQQYYLLGMPSRDGIPTLLRIVGLEHTGGKKVRHFSLGMRQRLGIAMALAGDPDLLIFDEPMNGLDPQGIVELRELILRLNRERQITFLISSHFLDELSRLATHYGIIDHGHMIKELSAAELDAACRKCVRMEVSDTSALARVLDRLGMKYEIISETTADVFARVRATQLIMALHGENCEVTSMLECHESLESYFISLIGGVSQC